MHIFSPPSSKNIFLEIIRKKSILSHGKTDVSVHSTFLVDNHKFVLQDKEKPAPRLCSKYRAKSKGC